MSNGMVRKDMQGRERPAIGGEGRLVLGPYLWWGDRRVSSLWTCPKWSPQKQMPQMPEAAPDHMTSFCCCWSWAPRWPSLSFSLSLSRERLESLGLRFISRRKCLFHVSQLRRRPRKLSSLSLSLSLSLCEMTHKPQFCFEVSFSLFLT